MIGIDIVDLQDPQLKDRTNRSLRFIVNSDDELIEHPHIYWLLWAAKEAVFKCKRETINFTPKHITIKLSEASGKVTFTSDILSGKIHMYDSCLMAICSDQLDDYDFETFQCQEICNSDSVRKAIIRFFEQTNVEAILSSDDLNLPILMPYNAPISLSHHYHWSAFAYPKSITN